jgi:hypothetical protein
MKTQVVLLKDLEDKVLIKVPEDKEILLSKSEFFSVFKKIRGKKFLLKDEFSSQERLEELESMLPLIFQARNGKIEAKEKLRIRVYQVCKKYDISENDMHSYLAFLEKVRL